MTTPLKDRAMIYVNQKYAGRDSNQSLRKKELCWKHLCEFIAWLEKKEMDK